MAVAAPQQVEPTRRRLRIFSHDPALATRLDFAAIAEMTISVPWEELKKGPVGEYIEVVDVDPASGSVYAPVDLDDKYLVATDGLAPSESNPQFHQQMTYAVAMATIAHFERALGRLALWSERKEYIGDGEFQDRFVRRLRIYPHALRDRNAFYSGQKKAVLFGYFPVERSSASNAPGTLVFTCLSHDIIAHEVTHALLDGVHPRFAEPVNVDVLAFHEAFADIVALFQHFSYPGILRDQIARTRGKLTEESLLGQLAQQFGEASGRGGALRSYLGRRDEKTGKWEPVKPDPRLIEKTLESHDRGAILVAAVFGAFTKVYHARTRDLYRIATEGTGVLREGDIHPDLVGRLADEAARCAEYILQMCIRAIDYCPPVAITFGAYLRGVITADYDMEPDDRFGFRVAFMESFREWGINPSGILSLAIDSLLWPTEKEAYAEFAEAPPEPIAAKELRPTDTRGNVRSAQKYSTSRSAREIRAETDEFIRSGAEHLNKTLGAWRQGPMSGTGLPTTAPGSGAGLDNSASPTAGSGTGLDQPPVRFSFDVLTRLGLTDDRLKIWQSSEEQKKLFWHWLMAEDLARLAPALGIVTASAGAPQTIFRSPGHPDLLAVEIHSVRTALRRDRRGRQSPDVVIEITQRRRGYFDQNQQAAKDNGAPLSEDEKGDFLYRAGCTLLMDPIRMEIRRVIRTPGAIDSETELERLREHLLGGGLEPTNAFAGPMAVLNAREPFALLHSEGED